MNKVVKTTFEAEQKAKEEAFMKLLPLERWEHAYKVRLRMRIPGVDYSYKGKTVIIKKAL
jgi:hypothetical protein